MLFLVNLSHTATKITSEPGNLSMSLIGLLGYCGSTASNSFNQKKIPQLSTTWKTMELTLLMHDCTIHILVFSFSFQGHLAFQSFFLSSFQVTISTHPLQGF